MYDELYHWGIKEMKWGVRRYRNPDGTLTPEGKERYARKEADKEARRAARVAKKEQERAYKNEMKLRNKLVKGKAKKMTTEELNAAIERMRTEDTFNQYVQRVTPTKQKSQGENIVKTMLRNGALTVSNAAWNKLANKMFGDKDSNFVFDKDEWTEDKFNKANAKTQEKVLAAMKRQSDMNNLTKADQLKGITDEIELYTLKDKLYSTKVKASVYEKKMTMKQLVQTFNKPRTSWTGEDIAIIKAYSDIFKSAANNINQMATNTFQPDYTVKPNP